MTYYLQNGNNTIKNIQMPFLENNLPKNKGHYISLILVSDIVYFLQIEILNSNFIYNSFQFINSTEYKIKKSFYNFLY